MVREKERVGEGMDGEKRGRRMEGREEGWKDGGKRRRGRKMEGREEGWKDGGERGEEEERVTNLNVTVLVLYHSVNIVIHLYKGNRDRLWAQRGRENR